MPNAAVLLELPQTTAARAKASASGAGRPSRIRTVGGVLEDGLLLMLVVFALPVAILLVGIPLIVVVQLGLAIARWL